jgi:hypothetical protein
MMNLVMTDTSIILHDVLLSVLHISIIWWRSHRWFDYMPTRARETSMPHDYEVRPRRDHRGVDLISDVLPFGRLWYGETDDAIEYAKFRSRSHEAVIRVYDAAGNVIEMHEHAGEFEEP